MQLAEPLARTRLLLAVAIVLQWVTTLIVALRAEHDGWRWGSPERAGELLDGTGLLTPIVLVNVLVLGPAALACAYRIALGLGGLALGAWTLLVWVGTPWAIAALTLASYDSIVRDRLLPLGLGLTPEPGYAAGALLLVAAALLTSPSSRSALLAGLAASAAVVLVPESILFAVPAAVMLLASRRPRELALFAAAIVPGLVAAAVWRQPSFADLSYDQLQGHFTGLREYFWSQRLLQWLPVAGAIAVARRSPPLAILLGGWFFGFVAFQATRLDTGFEDGVLFRVLLPALPAYLLLAAALPLLVPTLTTRLGALAQPARI